MTIAQTEMYVRSVVIVGFIVTANMDRQRHVAIWLRMLAEKEIRFARYSARLFKNQAQQAAAAYVSSGQGEVEKVVRDGQEDWYRLLSAQYTITAKDFISYAFEQLGAKKRSFQDIVQGFIAKNALEKSRLISGTTLDLIRSAILKGQQAGDGESDISDEIRLSVGGAIGESRSRTIARTEIHNAATYGMQAAAEETTQSLTREWVSVHDERSRESHAEADGQQKGMDEPFDVGGELIDRPGEGSAENAINCRCTLIYTPVSVETTGATSGEFI